MDLKKLSSRFLARAAHRADSRHFDALDAARSSRRSARTGPVPHRHSRLLMASAAERIARRKDMQSKLFQSGFDPKNAIDRETKLKLLRQLRMSRRG